MKITTQRSLIWLGNFGLVFCLLGFAYLMSQNSPAIRNRRAQAVVKELASRLDDVRAKPPAAQGTDVKTEVRTVFDRAFYYMGYTPPPKPVEDLKPTGEIKSPPLDTLLSLIMISAPGEGGTGSDDVEGALITIKSRPASATTTTAWWYRVGSIIGVTKNDEIKLDDTDPQLQKWGGARITAIRPDSVEFEWDKKSVTLKLGAIDSPGGFRVSGGGIDIGTLAGGGAKGALPDGENVAGAAGEPPFQIKQQSGQLTQVDLTKTGLDLFERDGEKLLDGVVFESVENPTDKNGKALKISAIPVQFQGAGIQDGDVIISVDSQPVSQKEDIVNYVRARHARNKNKIYSVALIRDGQRRTVRITPPRNLQGVRSPNVRFGSQDN